MKELVNKTDLKNERPKHQRKNERVCAARLTLWDTPKDRDLALNKEYHWSGCEAEN